MPTAKILTSVTAVVPAEREAAFLHGYRSMLDAPKPDGLLRSALLRGQNGTWLIQTLWRDRDAIAGARDPSKSLPPALALCEQVGATHSHEVLTVEDEYEA